MKAYAATRRRRRTARGAVQTIERTGKQWKLIQLLGALSIIVGVTAFIIGLANASGTDTPPTLLPAVLMGFLGFIVFAVGKIGAWWYHG